jgi:hypothetical protein
MDKFPEELNRITCANILLENQNLLMNQTRKNFTKIIYDNLSKSIKLINLPFDDKLWKNNRIIIANELLINFNEIRITFNNNKIVITKPITKPTDIPSDVCIISIIIDI